MFDCEVAVELFAKNGYSNIDFAEEGLKLHID